jgi:ribonuclease P protein component
LSIGRVSERRAFERLARDGFHARTETLWCRYLPDLDAVPPRLAFSIGRSVGPAVARNRLRRRLRAAIQSAVAGGQLRDGWVLVGGRPAALERTFGDLCDEVTRMLSSAVDGASVSDDDR